jgi:hypothetical protein
LLKSSHRSISHFLYQHQWVSSFEWKLSFYCTTKYTSLVLMAIFWCCFLFCNYGDLDIHICIHSADETRFYTTRHIKSFCTPEYHAYTLCVSHSERPQLNWMSSESARTQSAGLKLKEEKKQRDQIKFVRRTCSAQRV